MHHTKDACQLKLIDDGVCSPDQSLSLKLSAKLICVSLEGDLVA
jgi:hypothetical protein